MTIRHSLARAFSLLLAALPLACTDQPTAPTPAAPAAVLQAASSPTFYAFTSDSGELSRVNAAGEVEIIGPSGYLPVTALAADASGALYGTHSDPRHPPSLLRIDPETGAATSVGPTGTYISGLAFAPDGTLYGAATLGEIFTIDPATGQATLLARVGVKGSILDIALGPDGRLYASVYDAGGPGPDGHIPGVGDQLVVVDLQDPTQFTVKYADQSRGIIGIEFDAEGALWGTACEGILTIDPATGQHSTPTPFPNNSLCPAHLTSAPGRAQTTVRVGIDVRPGSTENPINRTSRGVVPVAVLGSADFDVAAVDPATVIFAGAPANARGGGIEDVNGDGYPDRVFHFDTPALDLPAGATEACLAASTTDGVAIAGCDTVLLVR